MDPNRYNLITLNHDSVCSFTDIIFKQHSEHNKEVRYTMSYILMLSGTHSFDKVIFEPI
jgi:hypothetical protein